MGDPGEEGLRMTGDLNAFVDWVKGRPTRSVTIEINGGYIGRQGVRIWAYDYALGAGQHVTDVSEIDLEAVKERQERDEYERLRRKYENASTEAAAEAQQAR